MILPDWLLIELYGASQGTGPQLQLRRQPWSQHPLTLRCQTRDETPDQGLPQRPGGQPKPQERLRPDGPACSLRDQPPEVPLGPGEKVLQCHSAPELARPSAAGGRSGLAANSIFFCFLFVKNH